MPPLAAPRGVADAKFAGHTCSFAPLSTRIRCVSSTRCTHGDYPERVFASARCMALIHCCNCLSCCSWGVASLVLFSASSTGLSCVPTRQENRNRLSTRFLSFHRCLSCPCPFSLPFPFLPFKTFPWVPFTCQISIGAHVSGVVCRPRSSQVLCASVHSRT